MRILFQGDSITDSDRNKNDFYDLGSGYPKYVAQYLREAFPEIEFEFINRGIYGHQAKDLLARWQEDAIDLQPDIISILVGVNETWHHCEDQSWKSNQVYEDTYRALLESVKTQTNAKIIMLEQYALDIPATEIFHNDIDEKIRRTRKLAREYADCYIPLDGLFASACVYEDASYWTADGVHPTQEGHKLIADYYFDAISGIIEDMMQ